MITIPTHLSGATGEKAKSDKNSQSCRQRCMPHIGLVEKGPFQLHKTCRVVSPMCWFGVEHPQPAAFSHSWISAMFNFSATPKRGC